MQTRDALVLALLVLSCLPQAAFTERLLVQVLDDSYRPVVGAQAYVEYQLNAVQGNTKTKPVLSNGTGIANLTFVNYEVIPADTKHSYTLYVKYGDQLYTQGLIATNRTGQPPRAVTQLVKAHYLSVNVRNQFGTALQAGVTVDGKTLQADKNGAVAFQLPRGAHTVKAEYLGTVRNKDVDLNSDLAVDMSIEIYRLALKVTDDNRKPLDATVEVDGVSKETDSQGIAVFENLTAKEPQVAVRQEDLVKRLTPDLSKSGSLDVVFDRTRPAISEVHALVSDSGGGTIGLFVNDPGAMSSGVDSVLVSYEVDGIESSIPAYTVGYNTFEAKIPAQPHGKVVKYLIRVADRDGNAASTTGTYIVDIEKKANQTGNGGGNPQRFDIQENLPIVILIIAVLAFALFLMFRGRNKPPPPPPPEVSGQQEPEKPPSAAA